MNGMYELVILEVGQFLVMTRFGGRDGRDNTLAGERQKMLRTEAKMIFVY